jgi:hypothetical protein
MILDATPKDGTLKSLAYWLSQHDLHLGISVDAARFGRDDIVAKADLHTEEATENLISSLRSFLHQNGIYPWPTPDEAPNNP